MERRPESPRPIVVVEDDPNIAELLGFMFRREGHATVLVRDGRAAEDHVAANEPAAAVVLDVMLPYRDGFAVATTIRGDPRWSRVPILMLSAKAPPEELERARALGVADWVTKPFQPHALVARVRALLDAPAP